jgi:hemolysin activation/secretion protein
LAAGKGERCRLFSVPSSAAADCSAKVFIAALLAAAGFAAFAQVAQVRPDAGQILEQIKERPPAPRPAPDVLPPSEEYKPALSPTPGLKVKVSRFRISGNTIFSEAELLTAVTEFVGKELDIDGLNDAATRVRAYYRERGYFLAQAYLPRQEIREGVVEIAVIEGRVGKLELNMKPGVRLSESLLRDIIDAHLKTGEIITETGLERPLLLINDLPNAIVTSQISPSKTVGAADLTVNVDQAPDVVNGFVDFDNAGNRFVGEYRLGVSLAVNSPFSLGDQLSVRSFATEERMLFTRLAYLLPVGPYGTRLGVSYTEFDYRLGKDFADPLKDDAKAHGYGAVWSIFAFHPIIRTRNTNLILQVAYEDKRLYDRKREPVDPDNTFITSTKLGVVGDYRDRLFGGGLNSYSFTITEGDFDIGVVSDLQFDQGATGRKAQGKFAKYNYDFRRLQRITDNTNLLLSVVGQRASKNLSSAEKFSLGGPSGVRAYPAGEAGGDSGWVFTGELRYIVPEFKLRGGDVTLSGFYDMGFVRLNKNTLPTGDTQNERTLAGYGLGLSVGKDGDFIFRTSAAWRAENERPQSDLVKRVPRVWFQAVKWF